MPNGSGVEPEEDGYQPPAKKTKSEWPESYSGKGLRMMQKMGYENDKGLGKANQGRLEPVEAVHQEGRKGFGLIQTSEAGSPGYWDESTENYSLPEKVVWLRNHNPKQLNSEELGSWVQFGPKILSLDNENLFCSADILNEILQSKSIFDQINEKDLRRARSRSNPFETIRSSIFLNRAAVKMANIDSMLGFMFTQPVDLQGNPVLKDEDLLYFADICAGPGGFSEYILFRKSWKSKGFGFTLRGPNDFKLEKFFAGSPESFDPYYGIREDGDVFFECNQDSFADYIHKHSPEGVHFVMADGGFSVEGQENIQEILSKQLYLCQCLTALKILRNGGHFVCKLFDIFTKFSVGLVYLMYNCFAEISIIKPNSSRPANSERYLVCKHKNNDTNTICEYLNKINNILNENNMDEDVNEIVDLNEIYEDETFYNYIKDSNNEIGNFQIIGLKKIFAYYKNPSLKEKRQVEFRKRCLSLWKLPEEPRLPPETKSTEKIVEEILGGLTEKFLTSAPTEMNSTLDFKRIESVLDWYCVPMGRGETKINTCSLFLCKSRGQLLRYSDTKNWEPVDNTFEVSPKSLFFGEIVYEYHGEGRTQTRVCALHIIDAIMIGGTDIGRMEISKRNALCHKYTLSINKPYKDGRNGIIRAKTIFKLKDVAKFFEGMRTYTLKDNNSRLGFALPPDRFFVPGGLILLPVLTTNFMSIMSKSTKMIYYFNKKMNQSYYEHQLSKEILSTLYENFRCAYQRRLLWKWTHIHQVEKLNSKSDLPLLCRYDFEKFVEERLCNT